MLTIWVPYLSVFMVPKVAPGDFKKWGKDCPLLLLRRAFWGGVEGRKEPQETMIILGPLLPSSWNPLDNGNVPV